MDAADFAAVFLFVSPQADFATVVAEAEAVFPEAERIACTTAGEIGAQGYAEGRTLAVGLPRRDFTAGALLIENLSDPDREGIVDALLAARTRLTETATQKPHSFAFMLTDGLSLSEDMLSALVAPVLGGMPFFGGSAGDGVRFGQALVALNGRVAQDAAVMTLVRTDCPTRVFSLNNLDPTEQRMVVTAADPDRRIVKMINAEPAAREYARIIGKDPDQLDEFTFAAHPVVVRLGEAHHVRSIQRVNGQGELVLFSAIDEGAVLTVADPKPMAPHLQAELGRLTNGAAPAAILACDCILRRIDAAETQSTRAVSQVLADHRVLGFSTYGEQIGPLHVNQTMTGVAIYPPERDRCR